MDLRLYDTLTKEKRSFTPLDPNNVRMYVCGPTVYDFAHIGNARPVIVFDVLFRLLRQLYGENHVTYVRNITDVDDKINDRAARDFPGLPLNEAIRKVTEVTATQFHADVAALGCLPPTFEPRATDFVLPRADGKTDMVTLIQQLIARGHAYEAGGEVLFDTQSMPDYGALSGRKLDEQRPGARVAVDAHKKSPLDFVLWKQSSGDEPGWESPWGRGRPGWHIECSAMSAAYLGDVFDIHGGGLDLIFPHHENEIAQSRCAHGTSVMANYWMHNGFLEVEGDKMSKSTGNFVTIRDLLRNWHGRPWSGGAIKLAMLSSHYRQPINWSLERLMEAEKELFAVSDHFSTLISGIFKDESAPFMEWLNQSPTNLQDRFVDCLADDLNVAAALAYVRSKYSSVGSNLRAAESVLASFELLGVLDRNTLFLNCSPILRGFLDPEGMQGAFPLGRKLQIGLLNRDQVVLDEANSIMKDFGVTAQLGPGAMTFLIRDNDKANAEEKRIAHLMERRAEARRMKDFDESDRIRNELLSMGVTLRDFKDPHTGEMKTEIVR
jgi:cysteinyl-tRNA synthetase